MCLHPSKVYDAHQLSYGVSPRTGLKFSHESSPPMIRDVDGEWVCLPTMNYCGECRLPLECYAPDIILRTA